MPNPLNKNACPDTDLTEITPPSHTATTARASIGHRPAVHWNDLATKDDLENANKAIEANKAAIEASEQPLRTEMHAEFTKVYAELHTLRTETA